jgi:xylose isomerase
VTIILSSLQIDLELSISARFGVGATAVAVAALYALIAAQIELGFCLLSLLGGAGGYAIYKSRQSYQTVFNSYYQVLDLAIDKVLKWTTTVTGSYTAKMSKEKKLQMLGGLQQSHNNLE